MARTASRQEPKEEARASSAEEHDLTLAGPRIHEQHPESRRDGYHKGSENDRQGSTHQPANDRRDKQDEQMLEHPRGSFWRTGSRPPAYELTILPREDS